MEEICTKAIEKAGGPAALAARIGGISPQAISQWRVVPAKRVSSVADVTGIPRELLRPDIFGAASKSPSKGEAA